MELCARKESTKHGLNNRIHAHYAHYTIPQLNNKRWKRIIDTSALRHPPPKPRPQLNSNSGGPTSDPTSKPANQQNLRADKIMLILKYYN